MAHGEDRIWCPECSTINFTRGLSMVMVQLLNGAQIAHEGKVVRMGDPNDVTVIVESQGMTFEAWDLKRNGASFVATNWKRLS